MTFVFIAIGFVLLFVGGELVVRGSVAIARRYSVSPLIIGLTIVGFGTSLPELVVSLNASLGGSPGIAVGNVIGSNMANMLLILGVAAVICPFAVRPVAVRRDGAFMLGVTVVVAALAYTGTVNFVMGLGMVIVLLAYLGFSLWHDYKTNDDVAALHREEGEEIEVTGLPKTVPVMVLVVLLGFAGLVFGSELLVDGAVTLARAAGVEEEVIGLTLVAIGTSLPELATSVVAAYRGHAEVCVGNVIGSNIFNLLGILGITAMAVPVPISDKIIGFDLWVLLIATALLLLFMLTGRRLSRLEGTVMLTLYGLYVAAQFVGMGGAMSAAATGGA